MTAEHDRLADPVRGLTEWHDWGPYVSERAWGTVREDYSADGDAWAFFPHDHARSRAYRWSEDALAGICDIRQGLCFGLALWNGRDPILKERPFGLANLEGNHGEDVKEYWWYLDGVPSSSWLSWRYHYPQTEFPYAELIAENAQRGVDDDEYELIDTGVFADDRYWQVTVDYAKDSPTDIAVRIRVRNAGPDADTLHVLPTLWARNTWSWDEGREPPVIRAVDASTAVVDHGRLGQWIVAAADAPGGGPKLVFCDNETNSERLFGTANTSPYPKDGINDHVIRGAATVNPARRGTKASWWYAVDVEPGEEVELRLRLTRIGACDDDGADAASRPDLGAGYDQLFMTRKAEADEFYDAVLPAAASDDDRLIARQASAGLLWSRQFYRYDVSRWLAGDPTEPPPPSDRGQIRNGNWSHLDANDIILMPDSWEYPWFASWDLAFHAVALARLDPGHAKHQLLLLTRDWYQHPNGALPAYEWDFGDANPPVQAFAAMRVFELDGGTDVDFLERMFHRLLLNFTWWVNRKDAEGNNVFEGGFLGLDNIGPLNRSKALPNGAVLEQSDGTAWMAMFSLDMLTIALTLARHNPAYEDMAVKFFEHFSLISRSMNESGLWDEEDGFYYDVVRQTSGESVKVRVRSMVGLIPLFALAVISPEVSRELPEFSERIEWFLKHRPEGPGAAGRVTDVAEHADLASVVSPDRLRRVLSRMLDEDEFLSPHGLRSLSKWHAAHPFQLDLEGISAIVDYEPAESRSRLFGGNSNWRGPVWFPLNFMVIEGLTRYWRVLGDDFTVEYPTGSGNEVSLLVVAAGLSDRLVSTFRDDANGRRPVFGDDDTFQTDPAWHGAIPFYEYFHGDTGAGLGASHQTGWTALVANLVWGLHHWQDRVWR